jgi:hypothetical protein
LARAAPTAFGDYTSRGVVLLVVVRLVAAAIQSRLVKIPTAPATIRITPTMSQFTNVPATREVGSIANLRIAPAAAKINDIPIRILDSPLSLSRRVLARCRAG